MSNSITTYTTFTSHTTLSLFTSHSIASDIRLNFNCLLTLITFYLLIFSSSRFKIFLVLSSYSTTSTMIKASNRAVISRSIFSTTFLVAFSLVLANSLVPCPVDRGVANDSKITPAQMQELMKKDSKK
ncbi:hypothetical protein C6P40_000701 [Pichia californica]|uniref:Transmembrane protein n=1 Tax=Pichia californica TaxID=460514 RepID=A0A9P6WMC1_9ASCO|nr:hypothetical protein C6P40_000701 [[Candida] californica]